MACCGVLVVIASVATAGVEMSAELAGVWVLLGACVFFFSSILLSVLEHIIAQSHS
jgi:hypothetical protein